MVVTKAAIMYENGEILEGKDYSSINILAHKLSMYGNKDYGFLASDGTFMLPNEAAIVAYNAGQIDERVSFLLPEDLWPTVGV